MKVIIDRFEGNYAICEKEDRTMISIDKDKLPDIAEEGDVLLIKDNNIIIDVVETKIRKKQIEELTRNLWN